MSTVSFGSYHFFFPPCPLENVTPSLSGQYLFFFNNTLVLYVSFGFSFSCRKERLKFVEEFVFSLEMYFFFF